MRTRTNNKCFRNLTISHLHCRDRRSVQVSTTYSKWKILYQLNAVGIIWTENKLSSTELLMYVLHCIEEFVWQYRSNKLPALAHWGATVCTMGHFLFVQMPMMIVCYVFVCPIFPRCERWWEAWWVSALESWVHERSESVMQPTALNMSGLSDKFTLQIQQPLHSMNCAVVFLKCML